MTIWTGSCGTLATRSAITVAGAKAAIQFTLKYPPQDRWPLIEQPVKHLTTGLGRKAKQITSPAEGERCSGIVTFKIDEAAPVAHRLEIIAAPRVNTFRVSPHFYNAREEMIHF